MANKDTKLNIIIDAKNRAANGISSASRNLNTLDGSSNRASTSFKGLYVAATAAAATIGVLGLNAIKAGAAFEQTQIAFEVMLGSAQTAQELLSDLSNFAANTPFELTQLEDASKRLLAYGIEADKLIPTLRTLGDITAGVGMDKLPQLILAFGQVKAATRLTGMELRQFTETGVPMLEALANHFNETKTSVVSVSNAAGLTAKQIDKLGNDTSRAESKLHSLNITLQKQSNRMRQMEKDNKDSGATWDNLQISIGETKRKIEETQGVISSNNGTLGLAAKTITTVGTAAQVTAKDIQQMVSDGKVSFDDVQAALSKLTAEGGKFHELMARQATTLGGLWSNLKDQIELTSRALGMQLLPYLKPIVSEMISMMESIRQMRVGLSDLSGSLGSSSAVLTIFRGLWADFVEFSKQTLTPAIEYVRKVFADNKEEIQQVSQALGILLSIFASFVGKGILTIVTGMIYAFGFAVDAAVTSITTLADWLEIAYNKMKRLIDLASSFSLIGSISSLLGARADGGPVKQNGSYLVGERGPEIFKPSTSGSIIPNHQLSTGAGGINITITGNTFMSDDDAAEMIGDRIMSKLKMSSVL